MSLKGTLNEVNAQKFINEIDDNETADSKQAQDHKSKRMDELSAMLQQLRGRRGVMISKMECRHFANVLNDEMYDSDAVVGDLCDEEGDPCNLYEDSNLYPLLRRNPFLAKMTRKHLGAKGNDDDYLAPFTFGTHRLKHWSRFKGQATFVRAKYANLKEECLQNSIYPMAMASFHRMVLTAFTYRETKKGRSIRAINAGPDNKLRFMGYKID